MMHQTSTDLVHVKFVTSFAKDYGSHLCSGLKSNLFLVHFQTTLFQVFFIFMHAIYHVHLIPLDLVTVSHLLNLKLATAVNLH